MSRPWIVIALLTAIVIADAIGVRAMPNEGVDWTPATDAVACGDGTLVVDVDEPNATGVDAGRM